MKRSEMIEKMQDILEHDYALVLPTREVCMAMLDMMEEAGMSILTWQQITETSNPSISGWPIRATTQNKGTYGWEEEE